MSRDNFIFIDKDKWEELFGLKDVVMSRELQARILVVDRGPGEEDDMDEWEGND
jgi:hypothetical protein